MCEKGDVVWVKNPREKCTTKYSTGRVTEVISPQSVKIDGLPRHVKDLRPVIQMQLPSSEESDSEDTELLIYLNSDPLDSDSDASSLPTKEASVEPRPADKVPMRMKPVSFPFKEVPDKDENYPPALFVIMRSGGGVWGKIMTLTYWTCA